MLYFIEYSKKKGVHMAMFPCPECKTLISETAETCPKCGAKITEDVVRSMKVEKEKRKKKTAKILTIGCLIPSAIIFLFIIISIVVGVAATTGTTGTAGAQSGPNLKTISSKKFGMTKVTMVLILDKERADDASLTSFAKEKIDNSSLDFVFFYTDKTKIPNLNSSKDALSAIPLEGFYAKYTSERGLELNTNKYVVQPAKGPLKIIKLEEKEKKGSYGINRWLTYYVQNYTDTKETDDAMIAIAKKAEYSDGGQTEVFFFNNKEKAPKLALDGGWGNNESENSWNQKYQSICVGYYINDGSDAGDFSKGWK